MVRVKDPDHQCRKQKLFYFFPIESDKGKTNQKVRISVHGVWVVCAIHTDLGDAESLIRSLLLLASKYELKVSRT